MAWVSRSLAATALMAMSAAGLTTAPIARSQPPASPARQCFYARNINNFTTPSDRLVYIRVGVRDIYRLDLMTDCAGLAFRQNVAFSHSAGDDICAAIDLSIRFRQNGISRVCPVSAMSRLSPDQVAALSKRDRP